MSDNICYSTALPGLMDPSEADGGINKNSANKEYSDPNGDLNIFIKGPYDSRITDFDKIRFKVFISKEDARNKCVALEHTGKAASENDESVDPTEVIMYYETDGNDVNLENLYLRIKHNQLMLARGTYVVRVYQKVLDDANEEDDSTDGYEALRIFTLTVKSDPIQGRRVNNMYLSTAFQGGNFIQGNSLSSSSKYNKGSSCNGSVTKELLALGYCNESRELDQLNGESVKPED